MEATQGPATPGAATPGAAALLAGRGTRRAFLVVHIVAAGVWIGIDVVLGVLVFTARSADEATAMLCYRILPLLWWPMIVAALVSLLTGLGLGLVTAYGILRHRWVVAKLVLNVVLLALIVLLLGPGLDDAAAGGDPGSLVFPPIVSTTALLVANVLSVYKPWGRVRSRRDGSSDRRASSRRPASSAAPEPSPQPDRAR